MGSFLLMPVQVDIFALINSCYHHQSRAKNAVSYLARRLGLLRLALTEIIANSAIGRRIILLPARAAVCTKVAKSSLSSFAAITRVINPPDWNSELAIPSKQNKVGLNKTVHNDL